MVVVDWLVCGLREAGDVEPGGGLLYGGTVASAVIGRIVTMIIP